MNICGCRSRQQLNVGSLCPVFSTKVERQKSIDSTLLIMLIEMTGYTEQSMTELLCEHLFSGKVNVFKEHFIDKCTYTTHRKENYY